MANPALLESKSPEEVAAVNEAGTDYTGPYIHDIRDSRGTSVVFHTGKVSSGRWILLGFRND